MIASHSVVKGKGVKPFGLPSAGCLTFKNRTLPYLLMDTSADVPAGCLSVLRVAYPDSWLVTFNCSSWAVCVHSASPFDSF